MPKKVSFEFFENILSDKSCLEENTNTKNINKLKNILTKVIKEKLTIRQQQIIYMYFFDNKNMVEISKELGINKSTVSRSINSAIKKINSILKYYI